MARDLSPQQKKIVDRYYRHRDTIRSEKLTDLVTELYLAQGAKAEALWKRAEKALVARQVAPARVEHVMQARDVGLLAKLAAELDR